MNIYYNYSIICIVHISIIQLYASSNVSADYVDCYLITCQPEQEARVKRGRRHERRTRQQRRKKYLIFVPNYTPVCTYILLQIYIFWQRQYFVLTPVKPSFDTTLNTKVSFIHFSGELFVRLHRVGVIHINQYPEQRCCHAWCSWTTATHRYYYCQWCLMYITYLRRVMGCSFGLQLINLTEVGLTPSIRSVLP